MGIQGQGWGYRDRGGDTGTGVGIQGQGWGYRDRGGDTGTGVGYRDRGGDTGTGVGYRDRGGGKGDRDRVTGKDKFLLHVTEGCDELMDRRRGQMNPSPGSMNLVMVR